MPGIVIPSRRSRSAVDDDDERSDLREDDSDQSDRSRASKRARQSGDDSPLLPESYWRSPRGSRHRSRLDMNGDAEGPRKHQPGSIVRVSLHNFVTYTDAEFLPGPNLNMIIGPNGTGKSTLVCAICLGLGWNTSHLGRAKEIGEFVKHGARQASIEIELAADPSRQRKNPVITCRITRDSKTEFLVDGKKSTKKAAQDLARSFHIQVDNLCQFLPQDRVVEFAALNPVDLLVQTQRAAAPEQMSEWHEELKRMRKEERAKEQEHQAAKDQLNSMQDRQKSQEGEVGRLRERTELQQRQAVLQKLRPFTEYKALRAEHSEAKKAKRAAQATLQTLRRNVEPNLRSQREKNEYADRLKANIQHQQRVLHRAQGDAHKKLGKCQEMDTNIARLQQEIEAERKNSKKASQEIPRLKNEHQRLQRAIDSPPPPFDPVELNERLREFVKRIREIETKAGENDEKLDSAREQIRQREQIIKQRNGEAQGLQSQAGRQTNKLEQASRDTAVAWQWIQDNRDKFQKDVHGPAMIECSVRDPQRANQVESVIGRSELVALTVTCEADFKMLQNQLFTVMKLSEINIRSSTQPLTDFRPPCSQDDLRQMGLESWVLDQLEGPEAVLAMICDNRSIHQTGFTTRDITGEQYKKLERSGLSSWVTPKDQCVITRRREYGDAGVSTRILPVKPASLLTDTPVDTQVQNRIKRQLNEAESEISEIQAGVKDLTAASKKLDEERKELQEEQRAVQEEKDQKQRQMSEYNGLSAKLEKVKTKWEEAKMKVDNTTAIVIAKLDEIDDHALTRGQSALDHSRALSNLVGLHEKLLETEIMEIEARSDYSQLRARHEHELQQLEILTKEVDEVTKKADDLLARGRVLAEQCSTLENELDDFGTEVRQQIDAWDTNQLETELQSLQAQLESLHGGNDNLIREYEQRARKIEEREKKLAVLDQSLESLQAEIAEIREQWEPELDRLIGQISEAFAENLSRIQCAGEVAVFKAEDFDAWAIQIKVKFREEEELSVLDSHRQSGGERAVSTIFYLMALQSLARAPFRVVDEINQGMDPRNERLVHSRMVAIACAEHTSQYFLITPKLLSGLDYHPNMKVHCIASGEYMPADHRELDFGALAQKALSVRARQLAAAAS